MRRLRIGFIGAGGIAGAHAASLGRLKQASIEKVMDVNPEAAGKLAGQTGAAVAGSADEIISDTSIEAVYILTPPQFHREYFDPCAKAGKRIFVEKPLAHTIEDARSMVRTQKRTGAFATVGFVLRYHPLWKTLKEMASKGAVGEIQAVWNTRTFCWKPFGWYMDPELGGLLKDFNAHDVDFLRWLVGVDVKEARGYCQALYEGNRSEDTLVLSMKFKNGVIASLNSSWYIKGSNYCIAVIGSEGTLYACDDNYNPASICHYDANNKKTQTKLERNVDMMFEEDRDFVQRALSGKEPPVPVSEAFASLKMTHQLYKALERVNRKARTPWRG
jgi:predicted dehydrogenase